MELLKVGTTRSVPGRFIDNTVEIRIDAEKLAEVTNYDMDRFGNRDEHRGITYSLYKLRNDGHLLYIISWSHWKGEPTIRYIVSVTEDDLRSYFVQVGVAAGLIDQFDEEIDDEFVNSL